MIMPRGSGQLLMPVNATLLAFWFLDQSVTTFQVVGMAIVIVALAIQTALAMPLSERRKRHQALMKVIRSNDIHAWHGKFLAELEAAGTTPAPAS